MELPGNLPDFYPMPFSCSLTSPDGVVWIFTIKGKKRRDETPFNLQYNMVLPQSNNTSIRMSFAKLELPY